MILSRFPGALCRFIGLVLCAALTQAQNQPPRPASVSFPNESSNLPTQKVGVDDLLGISVYDGPELTRTVRVSSDGTIRLPMMKQRIQVNGLFPADVETAIAAQLTQEQIMVDPIVSVSVVESRSRPISVAGAVKQPITFQASGSTTLLDALNRAGGLSDIAGPEILVTRPQQDPDGKILSLTQRITVKRLIDSADPELNLKLQGGEEVRVPEAGRVYIVGNVKKPGAFPMRDSAESSVLKALALAEGLAPYSGQMAYIYRTEGGTGGKNEIPIELKNILARKSPDVPLLANDVLYITDRSGRRSLAHALDLLGGGIGSAVLYTTTR
jgi:polysaccharide export outer membrane protein